jgi:hypothetical protein
VQLVRSEAWPTWSSARTDNRWDGIDQRNQVRRVMGVGGRKADGERDALAVNDEVVLRSQLAAIRGVTARRFAPLLARTLKLSTLARDMSIVASSPSQLSNFVCSCSQTPAFCQSRSRRQQVVPLPQPSAAGSSRHGHPVRRTKTIPARAARSGMRGRPPLGFGSSSGSSGSMASQRSSETSGWFIVTAHHAITSWVLKHALSL